MRTNFNLIGAKFHNIYSINFRYFPLRRLAFERICIVLVNVVAAGLLVPIGQRLLRCTLVLERSPVIVNLAIALLAGAINQIRYQCYRIRVTVVVI